MTRRLQITIKGNNVQRCGFRKAAVEMAKDLQLTGTAMYIDHDMLVEIEGENNNVEKFIAWAQIGPSQCNISEVEAKEIPVAGESSFNVVHGIVARKISA